VNYKEIEEAVEMRVKKKSKCGKGVKVTVKTGRKKGLGWRWETLV
jgi:hypothetical protein